MEWLNYHHLLYFWQVVKCGGVAAAANKLRLSHPTISTQVHALEIALGEKLLQKQGRRLVLTEMGTIVFSYAEEIFGLGRELLNTVKLRPTSQPIRLMVGIAEVVPKLIAKRLLAPARQRYPDIHFICREDQSQVLLAELATHQLDVVLSDTPLPPGRTIRAYNHLLGECGISIFGKGPLLRKYRRNFPASLHKAPMLLPTTSAMIRRSLDQWFDDMKITPLCKSEFDDSALMKVFGQDGDELFPSPTAIESEICQQYQVSVVGRLPDIKERFYAISAERKIRHPAVMAICETARKEMGVIGSP